MYFKHVSFPSSLTETKLHPSSLIVPLPRPGSALSTVSRRSASTSHFTLIDAHLEQLKEGVEDACHNRGASIATVVKVTGLKGRERGWVNATLNDHLCIHVIFLSSCAFASPIYVCTCTWSWSWHGILKNIRHQCTLYMYMLFSLSYSFPSTPHLLPLSPAGLPSSSGWLPITIQSSPYTGMWRLIIYTLVFVCVLGYICTICVHVHVANIVSVGNFTMCQ